MSLEDDRNNHRHLHQQRRPGKLASDSTNITASSLRRLAELTAAPDARVLDLGCGEGATLQELTGRVGPGGWLLGIDRNPRALTVAATAMPPGAPRWLLLCGDLAQPLPIATGLVDRVLCHNTLEALADPAGLLAEAHGSCGRVVGR